MTLIFGHRGYAAIYPENTMTSFKEALNAGADGLELDVQLSQDGELVVIHDPTVDRTTDGTGAVRELTLDQLKKLNAANHSKTVEFAGIPTLREVMEWLSGTDLLLNIELKNAVYPYKGMEEKVVELIREYHMEERVILSSFNHYSLVYCHRLAPDIETAPLYSDGLYMPWVYAESIRAKSIHPKFRAAPNEIIEQCQQAGIAVRPYTVNRKGDMKRLFKVGCTAFITDDPDLAVRLRKEFDSTQHGE